MCGKLGWVVCSHIWPNRWHKRSWC